MLPGSCVREPAIQPFPGQALHLLKMVLRITIPSPHLLEHNSLYAR